MIAKVAEQTGWAQLWDVALKFGMEGGLSRAMSHHGRENHPVTFVTRPTIQSYTVLEHILNTQEEQL